jgi:hypothetical protein
MLRLILKRMFQHYEHVIPVPAPFALVVETSGEKEVFVDSRPELLTARIHKARKDVVNAVTPRFSSVLTAQQFVSDNLHSKQPIRKAIPEQAEWTKHADFVIAPLSAIDAADVRRSFIGQQLDSLNTVATITVVAACTNRGCDYLAKRGKKYIVLGFGEGKIGLGCNEAHFGTAGIIRGSGSYDLDVQFE